jgi:ribosomal protein S18 acetylase RimI-like enzyme
MVELQIFQADCLPALIELWNRCFTGGPNFVALTEADFARRVTSALGFRPDRLLLAMQAGRMLGFVHFGPRLELWEDAETHRERPEEGQIYALVAPAAERQLQQALLDEAVTRLTDQGATRVLLYPSWVYGSQPMYNGIAGAYESPGLSDTRRELIAIATASGFTEVAECGTPELDLSDSPHLEALRAERRHLGEKARTWGLEERVRTLRPAFFPGRRAVTLMRGSDVIAMAAYGPWEEYVRQYGRNLFGITSVQVETAWRGRGLGKLVMLLALEAAKAAGAEAAHLHVYRANAAAWNLYHRALGFEPKWRWVTLGKG